MLIITIIWWFRTYLLINTKTYMFMAWDINKVKERADDNLKSDMKNRILAFGQIPQYNTRNYFFPKRHSMFYGQKSRFLPMVFCWQKYQTILVRRLHRLIDSPCSSQSVKRQYRYQPFSWFHGSVVLNLRIYKTLSIKMFSGRSKGKCAVMPFWQLNAEFVF